MFLCGTFAGLFYCVTHPLEAVKTRVQVMSAVGKHKGFISSLVHIVKYEGEHLQHRVGAALTMNYQRYHGRHHPFKLGENKKTFQLNANRPLSETPCCTMNKFKRLCTVRSKLSNFEHGGVRGRQGPVQGGGGLGLDHLPTQNRMTDTTETLPFRNISLAGGNGLVVSSNYCTLVQNSGLRRSKSFHVYFLLLQV